MYIQQAFRYQHEFWRYLLGVFIVIAAVIAGQMPFVVAIFMEKGFDTTGMDESELLRVLDSNLTLFLMLLPFAVALIALLVVYT